MIWFGIHIFQLRTLCHYVLVSYSRAGGCWTGDTNIFLAIKRFWIRIRAKNTQTLAIFFSSPKAPVRKQYPANLGEPFGVLNPTVTKNISKAKRETITIAQSRSKPGTTYNARHTTKKNDNKKKRQQKKITGISESMCNTNKHYW